MNGTTSPQGVKEKTISDELSIFACNLDATYESFQLIMSLLSHLEKQNDRRYDKFLTTKATLFKEDKHNRDEWREKIDRKIEKISLFIDKIEGPYNAGLWALRIVLGAFLLGLVAGVIEFIRRHVH